MSMERLSRQVDAYVAWKRELLREITRYQRWLEHNRLNSDGLSTRLERALHLLRTDHITLAFVGEFSRGKTELINSLFFAGFGQRILPSQPGRTTMCPTELFYDPRSERPYLRLLPIESRTTSASLARFKRSPRHWVNIPLDPSDAASMAQAFTQLARTKPMPVEQAIQLGFHPEMLEATGRPDEVRVPAWRHALVNFDHPLLRKGLRILDTPGLNALGSEPELALSMLPNAQAIIFVLAADSGVTATDLEVWQQHIRPLDDDAHPHLYAVLNKIDALWDDLAGEVFARNAIRRVQEATARQLGIRPADVLPLSAKQALLAKVRGDRELLNRSQINTLEDLLCERIVLQKERLIEEQVVSQVLALLQHSQHILNLRLEKTREEQELLDSHQQDNGQLLFELTARTKEDHAQHHRRLLGLKTNQRLLKRQGDLLGATVSFARLDGQLARLRQKLHGSWTSLGINQGIVHFFRTVELDLLRLEQEAEMANKMVGAIYSRHNDENPQHNVQAPRLNIQRYLQELNQLREKADQFRLNPMTLMTEQRLLGQRFFGTLGQEVVGMHHRLRQEVAQWANDALMPLMQRTLEQKQLLETHMLRLKALAHETQLNRRRSLDMSRYAEQLEEQLAEVNDMLRRLRRPSPFQRQAKVVNLPLTQRRRGGGESA